MTPYLPRAAAQAFPAGIQGATSVAASGPKQIQSVMGRVQHRIQQQRLRAMLRAVKDDLVDVQIGPQLYGRPAGAPSNPVSSPLSFDPSVSFLSSPSFARKGHR